MGESRERCGPDYNPAFAPKRNKTRVLGGILLMMVRQPVCRMLESRQHPALKLYHASPACQVCRRYNLWHQSRGCHNTAHNKHQLDGKSGARKESEIILLTHLLSKADGVTTIVPTTVATTIGLSLILQ